MQPDSHPDHALSFSADAVHLLRRVRPAEPRDGWEEIGSADFSSPSFRSDLADLRQVVVPEDGAPLPVVLVIPDDQILYTDLSVPEGPGREEAVGVALDGLTPYEITDLAFDWQGEGDDIRVAAVARQTLLEAQEFASRHGFDGREYSAQPSDDDYPGIPVFTLQAEDAADQVSGAPLVSEDDYAVDFSGEDFAEDFAPEEYAAEDYAGEDYSGVNLDLDIPDAITDAPDENSPEEITDVAYTEVARAEGETVLAPPPEDAASYVGVVEPSLAEPSAAEAETAEVEDAEIEEISPALAVAVAATEAAFADEAPADLAEALLEDAEIAAQIETIPLEADLPLSSDASDAVPGFETDLEEALDATGPEAEELIAEELPVEELTAQELPREEVLAEELLAEDLAPLSAHIEAPVEVAEFKAEAEAEDSSLGATFEAQETPVLPAEIALGDASESGDGPYAAEPSDETQVLETLATLPAETFAEPELPEDEQPIDEQPTEELSAEELTEEEPPEDDLTEAERGALAIAAAEVAAAEAAAASSAAKLGPAVVRHGAPPLETLNPRARAVRNRAEEARRLRGEDAPVAPLRKRVGGRGGYVELALMIGALLVGLVLVWAFFTPSSNPAQEAIRAAERGRIPEATGRYPAVPATESLATEAPASQLRPDTNPQPALQTAEQASVPSVAEPERGSALTPAERAIVLTVATEPLLSILTDPMASEQVDVIAQEEVTRAPEQVAQAVTPAPVELADDLAVAPTPAAEPSAFAQSNPSAESDATRAPVAATQTAAVAPTSDVPTPAAVAEATPAPQVQAVTSTSTSTSTSTPAPQPAAPLAATPQPAPQQAPAPAPVTSAPATPARTAEPAQRSRPAATQTTPRLSLSSSARPKSAGAARRRAAAPQEDKPPRVPGNPLPYEVAQRSAALPSSARPPNRPARRAATSAPATTSAPTSAATPARAATPAPAVATPAAASSPSKSLRSSSRPPSRPQGSTPDLPFAEDLSPAEQDHLNAFIRDLRKALPGAAAGQAAAARVAAVPVDRFERYAEARPAQRPAKRADGKSVDGKSVDAAVREATTPTKGAGRASTVPAADKAAAPKGAAATAGVASGRPHARPKTASVPAAAGGNNRDAAVKEAIASAVSTSSASKGGVELSALRSSAPPPRRSASVTAAAAAAAASAPAAAEAAAPVMTIAAATPTSPIPTSPIPTAPEAAAATGPSAAEIAERRRLDEQLQSQAEARIRARAQADAAAEAQARAQAEARARAQEEAEAQAAARNRQVYRPQEVDDEPDVALAVPKGDTNATVASAATEKRVINMGQTTIIGIIGAGQASRALIRLGSGKIVTVRLGDKIDGGTINSIGDGRITYVKGGQLRELKMLNGR